MGAHLFGEKVVHYASSVLGFDPVEDTLHAKSAKPGTEREQHLVNPRFVHGLKARRVEVQKALLHDLKILWPKMANGSLFTRLEPAFAIPHEHYGVAEVLLKRDFAQGCRARRCAEFGQTGNGHRISSVRLWCRLRRDDADLRFHLLELLHGAGTTRASDATLLEAAFFEGVVDESPSVDPHCASFDGVGDSLCTIDIFGEDRGSQTEDGGIRAGDRFVLCRESLKAQHGAEDFLLDQWNV